MFKCTKIAVLLIFLISSSISLAMDLQEVKFGEEIIDLNKAISLGLKPELLFDANKRELAKLRIEYPKNIGACLIRLARVDLFMQNQRITSYGMSKLGTFPKNNMHFSAEINPDIVDSILVRVLCKNMHIYKFSVPIYTLMQGIK